MNKILTANPAAMKWTSRKALGLLRLLPTVVFYLCIAIVAIMCALHASQWIESHFPRDLHLKKSICTEIAHCPTGWTSVFFFAIFMVIPLIGFQILGLLSKQNIWAWKKRARWIFAWVAAYALSALTSMEIYKVTLTALYS